MTALPHTTRAALEQAIEALIALLDAADGDADLEPDEDHGADDLGEAPGETFRAPPPAFATLSFGSLAA